MRGRPDRGRGPWRVGGWLQLYHMISPRRTYGYASTTHPMTDPVSRSIILFISLQYISTHICVQYVCRHRIMRVCHIYIYIFFLTLTSQLGSAPHPRSPHRKTPESARCPIVTMLANNTTSHVYVLEAWACTARVVPARCQASIFAAACRGTVEAILQSSSASDHLCIAMIRAASACDERARTVGRSSIRCADAVYRDPS